jgi:hypothetical protein
MGFIHGICLAEVLTAGGSRLIKEDIGDDEIDFIYRQMAQCYATANPD